MFLVLLHLFEGLISQVHDQVNQPRRYLNMQMSLDRLRLFVNPLLLPLYHCQLFLSLLFPRPPLFNLLRLCDFIVPFPRVFQRFRKNFPLLNKHMLALRHPDIDQRLGLLTLSLR